MKAIYTLIAILFTVFTIQAQTVSKRYEVKSGKITLVSEMFGTLQDMVIYFDDYGMLEYTSTTGTIMGFKVDNVQIRKEGYLYALDMNQKTCKKTKLEEGTPQNINFSEITQKMIDDLRIQKTGTEEFLNRTCDVWTMDQKDMRMKGYFLIWNGISLKTELEASGMIIRMKATEIDTETSIPKDIFEIPADFKMIE